MLTTFLTIFIMYKSYGVNIGMVGASVSYSDRDSSDTDSDRDQSDRNQSEISDDELGECHYIKR